jgi:hypothetical protein
MEYCECGAPLAFSPDGVHCVGCSEAAERRVERQLSRELIASLVTRLEQERSLGLCEQLARALGYEVVGTSGMVQLDKPESLVLAVYFQLDALIEDVLEEGKHCVDDKP